MAGFSEPSPAQNTHYPALSVTLTPQRVSEHVWFVQGLAGFASHKNEGFMSNAGFVVTDDGIVVFDSLGSPALGAQLLKEIRRISDQPIRRVIISHYHSDHFYGAQAFSEAGVDIWAGQAVRDYLLTDAPALRLTERRNSLSPWVNKTSKITEPTHFVSANTSFTLAGVTFSLLPAGPAHTAEDLMMRVEPDGVLFVGDLIFSGRVPYVGDGDSKNWLSAIERLIEWHPRVVIPGHGAASTDPQDLATTRDYLRHMRRVMGAAVEDMVPFDEAFRDADWSKFSQLPVFGAANRNNAYNTFIRMEAEALQRAR